MPPSSSDTSDLRRAIHHTTDLLPGWRPAQRPAHIPPTRDAHRLAVAPAAQRILVHLVPPLWPGPHTAVAARANLVRWTWSLGDLINTSSRHTVIAAALNHTPPELIEPVNAWLAGTWSTRPALEDLCWRLEVGPAAISAALWLYAQGAR